MKRLLAILLVSALLATAGCAIVQPKEEGNLTEGNHTHSDDEWIDIYTKPPALTLYYGTGSTLLDFAGCSWYFRQEDGTMSAPFGDPVDMPMLQNSLEALREDGGSVKLSFALEPDELSVTCWPYEDWVKGQADSHTVNAFENVFAPRPGGWVYGIRATWNDSGRGYYGTAEYYIYIERPKAWDNPLARES